jgi:hypothetical protein
MPQLSARDFFDNVNATLDDLGPPKAEDIAQSAQDYPLYRKWFDKSNRENIIGGNGIGVRRNLANRTPDSAAHVGWADPDNVTIDDLTDNLQMDWVHATQSWGVIYQTDVLMNGNADAEKIFDLVKLRRQQAMLNLVEEIEEKAWSAPTSSSDKRNPWGITYWIVKNSSTGFYGGAPSGHTTVGNVSLTDSPTFKNYTATYSLNSPFGKNNGIKQVRTAMRKCHFKSPIPKMDYSPEMDKFCLYVGDTTTEQAEEVGESQNENLKSDLAPSAYAIESLRIRGRPLIWAPELDGDTSYPIYGVNHATWEVRYLEGDWFRESNNDAPNQHNIRQYFIDLTYNFLCFNRRKNFVVHAV